MPGPIFNRSRALQGNGRTLVDTNVLNCDMATLWTWIHVHNDTRRRIGASSVDFLCLDPQHERRPEPDLTEQIRKTVSTYDGNGLMLSYSDDEIRCLHRSPPSSQLYPASACRHDELSPRRAGELAGPATIDKHAARLERRRNSRGTINSNNPRRAVAGAHWRLIPVRRQIRRHAALLVEGIAPRTIRCKRNPRGHISCGFGSVAELPPVARACDGRRAKCS